MPNCRAGILSLCLGLAPFVAHGQAADDAAALDLKPATEPASTKARDRSLRVFGEVAVGRLSQRYGLQSEDTRRASIDFNWQFKPAAQWRAVISDRLDDIHPVDTGSRSTLNSLREAFVGWQADSGREAVDFGRVNLRFGPAYGFNPTDYFRDGASRAVTSADPLALRENRLGTAILRLQKLWDGGSASVVLAPKLRDGASDRPFSLDLGATNHSDRALLTVSTQTGQGLGVQGFVFNERGKGLQLGVNATALLSDSAVGFVEWSGGKDNNLLSETFDPVARVERRHRAALGVTYTTASRLAATVELEYNGFALDKAQWGQALARYGIEPMGAYLFQVQRRQDIASRRAALVYLSQRDAFVKNLEVTGLVRYNVEDRSRFVWAEARYHWSRVDVALQWQANMGGASSEYGALPGKRLVQILAAFYY